MKPRLRITLSELGCWRVLSKLSVVFGLVMSLASVVLYIRGRISKQVSLEEANATVAQERNRVRALEDAAAEQRAARAKEVDEKVSAVRTADDAARLLREATTAR